MNQAYGRLASVGPFRSRPIGSYYRGIAEVQASLAAAGADVMKSSKEKSAPGPIQIALADKKKVYPDFSPAWYKNPLVWVFAASVVAVGGFSLYKMK